MDNRLIIIYGLPGAGKTTLSEYISRINKNYFLLSNDRERIRLGITVKSGKTYLVYEKIIDMAVALLKGGKDVIIDATFYRKIYQELLMSKLEYFKPVTLIIHIATPGYLCKKRIMKRQDHISNLGIDSLVKFKQVEKHFYPWVVEAGQEWLTHIKLKAVHNKWILINESDFPSFPKIWDNIFNTINLELDYAR